jgi:hypothetical protein
MSLTYGFFNSVDGDRMYNAIQVSSIFDGIIEDGVFGSIGDAFQVLATTGLGTSVGTGRAWFDHTWTYNDAVIQIVLDGSDPILPRYDAIILEVDESVGVRANSIKKVTGTPATTPVYPTLTNTEYVHQYPFAYVLVNGGATSINQASITNMIGQGACPFVTGPLSVISTNDLVAQWEEEFNLWFDQMQDQLSEEAAGNLQLQINAHNHGEVTSTQVVTAGIATGAVTIDKLASDSVDDSKIEERVPVLPKRQGSNANVWNDGQGSLSNYTLTNVKMSVGVKDVVMGAGIGTVSNLTVTFPDAFWSKPLIYCTAYRTFFQNLGGEDIHITLTGISAGGFTFFISREYASPAIDVSIMWMAIGEPDHGIPL